MSQPINLAITGKPSPRTAHPASRAGRRTPMNENRARNQRSSIFGGDGETYQTNKIQGSRKQSDQVAIGVVTKDELQAIQDLTSRDTNKHVAVRSSPRKPAPDGVPKLSLDGIVGKEDHQDMSFNKLPTKTPNLGSPTSQDTYSWGTPAPIIHQKKLSIQTPKGGGWQVNQNRKPKKPESSSRKRDDVPSLDLKLSQSNQGLAQLRKAAQQVNQDVQIEYMGIKNKQKLEELEKGMIQDVDVQEYILYWDIDVEVESFPFPVDHHVLLHLIGDRGRNIGRLSPWRRNISACYTLKCLSSKKHLGHTRKADFIDTTVVADQLNNVCLDEERPCSPQTTTFGVHQKFDSRMRRHQDMHSSPIDQAPAGVDLTKRLQFGARLLSLDGHDARREINGFFFVADQTITLYEFRQFGTRSNALPFIQKGNYSHVTGYRQDKPYTILDITPGKDISFNTNNQPSIPDSLRKKKVIIFRVTEVDEVSKKKLLYINCRTPEQRNRVEKQIGEYENEERNSVSQVLLDVRASIRQKLKERGAKTMTNLYNHFINLDRSGDGLLDKNELQKALRQFRINIDETTFASVWKILDRNNDGHLDYGEFVRGFCGEMNEERKKWVRKAFTRLDPKRSGIAKLVDLQKFFCAAKHPNVLNGTSSENQVLEDMINVFKTKPQKTEILNSEFEAFYEGVSMGVEKDEDFTKLIRSTWTL